jgi:hypothetical protein
VPLAIEDIGPSAFGNRESQVGGANARQFALRSVDPIIKSTSETHQVASVLTTDEWRENTAIISFTPDQLR